jgi:hypothetical protein
MLIATNTENASHAVACIRENTLQLEILDKTYKISWYDNKQI